MLRKHSYLLLVFFFCYCGASKIQTDENKTLVQPPADEIVFVVFKVTKNAARNVIAIISTAKSYGKMKAEIEKPISSENYLTIEIFQNERLVQTKRVEHPLLKYVEYPNENNQYVSKQLDLDEAEFFIRLQKKQGSTKIRISETLKNKSINELQTFTL